MTDKEFNYAKSPRQLKDKINNLANNNIDANTLMQNYMMERFLERVANSKYKDNIILKGGFLIVAIVGADMRSTMDMDTTIRGIAIDKDNIENIISEIISIHLDDNITFEIQSIKPIHEVSDYDDFRIVLVANFDTIKQHLKIDITTGDTITPKEIQYPYKLMFGDKTIDVMAYNIYVILSEKIETILSRNVLNTRARDFYDVYILLNKYAGNIDSDKMKKAILSKAKERNSLVFIEKYEKYFYDIKESQDLQIIWSTYQNKYLYAKNISYDVIMKCLENFLVSLNLKK